MKIAVVYEKLSTRGGLERYVYELASHLARNHEVIFVTTRMDDGIATPFDVRVVPTPRPGMLRLVAFDKKSAVALDELQPTVSLGFGRTTRQTIHRAGGGCHKVYCRTLPPAKRWSPKTFLELAMERRLYLGGGTRRFVFNSALMAEQVCDTYGVDGRRTVVIPTAVDGTLYRPSLQGEREAIREQLGLGRDEFVGLFVSLEHERKGLAPLLRAWENVGGTLLVVGSPLSRRLQRLAMKSGSRVRMLGMSRALPEIYRAADLFIHPTRYDACANTVLQALSSGLPALVSNRDGASEFVEQGGGGFVLESPESPSDIAGMIGRYQALDAMDRKRLGVEARAITEDRTWELHAALWERVIQAEVSRG